ncbi:MAG: glycosyltransferase family 4 protein [Caulobacterales bacterium]
MTGSEMTPPKIALVVFRLEPAGGLEQHSLRLASELIGRGCAVTLVTTRPPAASPPGAELIVIAERGRTTHGRLAAFAADAARAVADRFDRTVAFHAIPGFDLIFCADPSRARPPPWRSVLPRYRAFADLERRAFAPTARTRVLFLSSAQLEAFARHHRTPPERLILLPPTVDRLRADPDAGTPAFRNAARRRYGADRAGPVWLWMGLQPRTKGLDRALEALAASPSARLLICGLRPESASAQPMQRLAGHLSVASRVTWLGFLGDGEVPGVIAAADLLIHPSRADVTGTVILEAMAGGLPVVTTAVCGYGEHVRAGGAGVVLDEPFRQADLDAALASATPKTLRGWSAAALAYARQGDLFSGLERAADVIQSPLDAQLG